MMDYSGTFTFTLNVKVNVNIEMKGNVNSGEER